MAKVIFSVGVAHPLYGKVVDAVIENDHCGYDGRRVYGHTVEPVYWPEDKKGIFVYDKYDHFDHYETKPAYSEIWEGYIEKVVSVYDDGIGSDFVYFNE